VDTFNAIAKAIFGTPADQQAEAKEKLAKETLPAQLTNFEKLLEKNGNNGFFVGSKLSYADVTLWVALQLVFARVEGSRDQLLGAFPAVKKLIDGVSERERIKAYVARDVYSTKAENKTA
jgi:glutathione S-transferase